MICFISYTYMVLKSVQVLRLNAVKWLISISQQFIAYLKDGFAYQGQIFPSIPHANKEFSFVPRLEK